MIILHGWGSSADVMKPMADRLSDIRTCVLLDLPGFGDSPEPPEPWSVSDYADMVFNFSHSHFPGQKVDFLVHSFGGRILLALLSSPEYSLETDKLIITGGAGLKPKRSFTYHMKRMAAKILKAPVFLLPLSKRERAMDLLRQTPVWKALGSSDYRHLSGVMRETFVKSVTEFFDDRLSSINKEILLLWGKDDTATPVDQAKRLEKGIKDSVLIEIENAGHYAFLDQPSRFHAIIRSYLEG